MLTPGTTPLVGVFTGVGNDITGADDVFLEIIGRDRSSFEDSRRTLEPLSPPDCTPLDLAALRQAAAARGFSSPYQKTFLRPDGSSVPVLVVLSFLPGEPQRWVAGAVDLSTSASWAPPTDAPALLRAPQPLDFYAKLLGALLTERTRILAMLDGTRVLIWSVDPELRLLGANRAFDETLRARSDRQLRPGDPIIGLTPNADDRPWVEWYRRALGGESFEVRQREVDGAVFDLSFTPICDADDTALGVAVVGTDVTAEHVATERLARREMLSRIAGELGRVAGWLIEVPSGRLVLSEELAEFLHLDPARTYTVDQSLSWYPEVDQQRVRRALEACIAVGTPFDLETEFPLADGSTVWGRVIGEARLDDRGVVSAVHGAVVDVTEHKRLEHRLREQAGVIANSNDAILVRDLDGRITSWNRAAERLYGWSAEEAIGRHIADLVDGGDREKFHEMNEQLWTDGTWTGRVDNVDRAGRRFIIDLHVDVIRSADGTPDKVFSIASDATERVELEEQLALAQRLDAIGQLTGGIAHDFNNLLTVIIGGCELIAESTPHDSEVASLNAMVLGAAEQGALLTNRLLAFARRQTLQPRALDPSAVIDDLVPLLKRSIPETIEITVDHADQVSAVAVDPGQLEAALLNVALNARDAMPDGGVLSISLGDLSIDDATPAMSSGHYVEITIADTGVGMDPSVRDRAFDPFFTTKAVGRGSGLGLSMVYGFARQSGGNAELWSEPGQGTTVRLLLPRVDPDRAISWTAQDPALETPRGKEHVLVVEDEPFVRRHAASVLRELGYRVEAAEHGPAALSVLESLGPVDLVFTDVVMPGGLTGTELARTIAERWPGTRILFTSGYTDTALTELTTGDQPVLSKPYRRHDLAVAVRAVLDATPETSRPPP